MTSSSCIRKPKEDSVLQQLIGNDIDAYYPCIKVWPVNPRSRKIKPYFPGYSFVNANLDVVGTSILQWIPGVIGLVSFGGELASVPDDFLRAIQSHVDRRVLLQMLRDRQLKVELSGMRINQLNIFSSHK